MKDSLPGHQIASLSEWVQNAKDHEIVTGHGPFEILIVAAEFHILEDRQPPITVLNQLKIAVKCECAITEEQYRERIAAKARELTTCKNKKLGELQLNILQNQLERLLFVKEEYPEIWSNL